MKNLKLFLVLLFVSVCVYLTPSEYYEFMFGLFASAGFALLAVYGYSRKVNPILKSLVVRIKKVDTELMDYIRQLRREFEKLNARVQELERKNRR